MSTMTISCSECQYVCPPWDWRIQSILLSNLRVSAYSVDTMETKKKLAAGGRHTKDRQVLEWFRQLSKEEAVREKFLLADWIKAEERKQLLEEYIDLFILGG